VNTAVRDGMSAAQAIQNHKDLLIKSNVDYVKPERVQTFEIGYKSLIVNKLLLDANYYYNIYNDFILTTRVVKPQTNVLTTEGSVSQEAAADVINGKIQTFILTTNAADKVSSQGATLGVTYQLPHRFTVSGNGTMSFFNIRNANPARVPAYNTPRYRSNVLFGNHAVYKNTGFNISWHWQDSFEWYGAFNDMRPGKITAFSTLDVQINHKFPSIKSVVKVGGNNLLNHRIYQAYGSASIGAMYYISLTFNELLH